MTEEAPAHRQFIAVKFRSDDERTYTYHNDGEPVGAGETVKLPPRGREDGWVRGVVTEAFVDKPKFPTKAILGVVDPNEAQP